jgi:hypothetical protein
MLFISLAYATAANFFDLGDVSYRSDMSDSMSVGLGDAKLYSPALGVIILIFHLFLNPRAKYRKVIGYIVVTVVFLYLVFSLRRTTIIIVVLGLVLYLFYANRITRIIPIILSAAVIMLATAPWWSDFLEQRMSLRNSTAFSSDYNVTSEGRYQEFVLVLQHSFQSTTTALFGTELFNSAGNYGFYNSTRIIHIDYLTIIHGSGIFGLLIYVIFYLTLFRSVAIWSIPNQYRTKKYQDIYALLITFIILSLVISLSGQMYTITFRSILFIYIGSLSKIIFLSRFNYTQLIIQKPALPILDNYTLRK